MKGLFKKTFNSFEPADENAEKIIKRYKFGELAEGEFKKKRNIKFHGKLFLVLNLTFKNQDFTDDFEHFREAVTVAAGFWHYQKQLDGSDTKRADSISFDSMDDIQFSEVYNRVFDVCLSILGCKSEELARELLKLD